MLIAVLTNTNYQRTAFTGSYKCIGIILIDEDNYISAYYAFQRNTYSFFEAAFIVQLNIFNEFQQYFSIGIADKIVAFFLQLTFQLVVVLNDSIVDHCQFSIFRKVRVRIAIARFAMGSPTG